jgi:hypothetical protein
MFTIEATQIQGQIVRPAPWGVEDGQPACLVYVDDRPGVMIPYCKVTDANIVVTAGDIAGLKQEALRVGLICSDDVFMP